MKVPEFTKCPGCGVEPKPIRDNRDDLSLWCEKCEFNASIVDTMHADYLVRFYPQLSIQTAAQRIRDRQPLMYSKAKVA